MNRLNRPLTADPKLRLFAILNTLTEAEQDAWIRAAERMVAGENFRTCMMAAFLELGHSEAEALNKTDVILGEA